MDFWLTAAACAAWLSLPPVLLAMRRSAARTCLRLAWRWCLAAWIIGGAAALVSQALELPGKSAWPGISALLWYALLVALLVPPIAVLGARRPIHRVWNWFVLWPLVLVFSWPVLSLLARGKPALYWNLETPVAAGYVLVLVMGTGNYLGTRFTIPSLFWGVAAVQLLLPFCSRVAPEAVQIARRGDVAIVLLAAAGWFGYVRAKQSARTPNAANALDPVWAAFRDAFGIVWARRIADGFNEQARQAGSCIRLGMRGFEALAEPQITGNTTASPFDADKQLRWFLQKFVEPEWIDERMS